MHVSQAIKKRHSTRAFSDKTVTKETIRQIIDTAKHAPSGVNMQPWKVAVLTANSKAKLSAQMVKAFREKNTETTDYQYYPTEWNEIYKSRRVATGKKLYEILDIQREDKEKRLNQWEKNYRAFDAPVMLLFFIDKSLATGSYLDYGMFLQNIMLLAQEQGLATCPQASLAEYPGLVKSFLDLEDNWLVLGGMALGYEDTNNAVNQYRTEREELENFCEFYD